MEKKDLTILANEDVFRLIGKEWMLITAGTSQHFNTMTASWGGLGWLWNKPVAFIFVRPERYTYEFIESGSRITLSFLSEDHRAVLNLCGSKSGREIDKVKECGLTPLTTDRGAIAFAQSRLTLDCRPLFRSPMQASQFQDQDILSRWYNDKPGGSLHVMYVLEIEDVYEFKFKP